MLFPRWLRAPSFNDAVSFFYVCSHVGQFVGRFVSSYPGVGFDVSYTNVLSALQLQLSVRRSQTFHTALIHIFAEHESSAKALGGGLGGLFLALISVAAVALTVSAGPVCRAACSYVSTRRGHVGTRGNLARTPRPRRLHRLSRRAAPSVHRRTCRRTAPSAVAGSSLPLLLARSLGSCQMSSVEACAKGVRLTRIRHGREFRLKSGKFRFSSASPSPNTPCLAVRPHGTTTYIASRGSAGKAKHCRGQEAGRSAEGFL